MNTRVAALGIGLLGVVAFVLALRLEPWSQLREASRSRSGSLLQVLLGDGRRLFANHFFARADAYFHRGVYPSVFDDPRGQEEEMHMVTAGQQGTAHAGETPASATGHDESTCTDPAHDHDHDHADGEASAVHAEDGSSASSVDWIARLNDRLRPQGHRHLGGAEAREMLPWLQLSAELDPERVETYVVTAYWLRVHLGKTDEAEQFLRLGLQRNPNHPELLFELGRLYQENREDPLRSRNLLELAFEQWNRQEGTKAQPDLLLRNEILIHRSRAEEKLGNLPAAVRWLEELRRTSPHPEAVQRQIDELTKRINAGSGGG